MKNTLSIFMWGMQATAKNNSKVAYKVCILYPLTVPPNFYISLKNTINSRIHYKQAKSFAGKSGSLSTGRISRVSRWRQTLVSKSFSLGILRRMFLYRDKCWYTKLTVCILERIFAYWNVYIEIIHWEKNLLESIWNKANMY